MGNSKKGGRGKAILAVILCVPLAFIVYFWISYSSQSITLENVKAITIKTPYASEAVFESQEDIDFYVDMILNSRSMSTSMRDVSGEEPVYITCDRGDKTIEYKLYPTLNLSGCLLVGPESKLYAVSNETAKTLLLRQEFDYLYSSLFLPQLSVVSGENTYPVSPIECDWNYYKSDGNIYSYSPESISSGEETFVILKGLDNTLRFTPDDNAMPYDLLDITYIAANGSQYSIEDISELNLSVDTLVSVSFTAKWSSMNGAQAYGEAKYKFNILYDIPAVLELPGYDYKIGDIIEVYASHLNNGETVELETTLDINNFEFGITNNDKGVALIPIGLKNGASSYMLNFKTGVGTVSETVNIVERESGEWATIAVDIEQYQELLSIEKMNSFNETISQVVSTRPEKNYFVYGEGKLRNPVGDKKIKYGFGQTVNLGSVGASGDTGERICEGVVYELPEGTSVRAAQAGRVVFSGTLAPTGNTVIVYHGYGIYSYYYHLDSLNVREGYELNDGEIIGTAGKSGFTNDKTVLHHAISIDGIFVDPQWFYGR